MPPIVASTDVNRSARDVFAYVTDPTCFHEWQKGVIGGHMDDPGRPGVGARCVTVRRIGFADRPSTSELLHIDPPKAWRVRGIDGPIRATVDVTVQALTDERARLAIAIDFEGHGIGKLLVPFVVRRETRKEMPGNLATLKQRLERQT
ncbi:MAG: SRPBCC family protein [Geodermatophilaceae bacterium]